MSPPHSTPRASSRLLDHWEEAPSDVRERIRVYWLTDAGGGDKSSVSVEQFGNDVLMLWKRGRARRGLEPSLTWFQSGAHALAWRDLHLARRCEHGSEAAWREFSRRYSPDVEAAIHRGYPNVDAQAVAASVMADMWKRPKGGTPDRTQLGRYEGMGPLWAWLAAIGLRRAHEERVHEDGQHEATSNPLDPNDASLALNQDVDSEERDLVEVRGQSDPVVVRLIEEAKHPRLADAIKPRGRSLSIPLWAVGAALAALALVAFLLFHGDSNDANQRSESASSNPAITEGTWNDRSLASTFKALAAKEAQAFQGFTFPDAASRKGVEERQLRSNELFVKPAAAVLEATPTIRWLDGDGNSIRARQVFVQVMKEHGGVRLELNTDDEELEWPIDVKELEPGVSYTANVSLTHNGVRHRGSTTFRVISDRQADRYERACQRIEREVEGPVGRALLLGYTAVHFGLLEEAWVHLNDVEASGPSADALDELIAYLQRLDPP